MAACCTIHQPAIISKLLNNSHTKKPISEQKIVKNFLEKGKWAAVGRKKDRKSNGSRQKYERGDGGHGCWMSPPCHWFPL